VYTDGSKIDPNPKLGAAVIHKPTHTSILIDATGIDENNTVLTVDSLTLLPGALTLLP
jgi:hypothetical protein